MKESPAVARSHGTVADPGVHTRCVVTAMEPARTTVLARPMSWARGQAENAIKEPNLDLTAERTSWQRFEAYQVRLWWPCTS